MTDWVSHSLEHTGVGCRVWGMANANETDCMRLNNAFPARLARIAECWVVNECSIGQATQEGKEVLLFALGELEARKK